MLTLSAEAPAVRRVPVLQPGGRKTYSVVGSDGLPIPDVESYLGYLRAAGHSANTVRAYAGHLAFLFRWAALRGISWELLDFDAFVAFIDDMADGTVPSLTRAGRTRPRQRRGRATLEATLAAVCAFLDYWRLEGRGPQDLKLYCEARTGGPTSKTFLAHVENRNRRLERRIKVNAVRRVKAIGRRAGISLTPHTLRHTHGTDLARHDWTAPMIAKRLGHSSATSADIYIHLADDDIASKYQQTMGHL